MASKFEEPVADKKKKKNSSFVSGDAVMPKWAQKTVTLPPHTRGCHLVTPLVRMLYFLHFQRQFVIILLIRSCVFERCVQTLLMLSNFSSSFSLQLVRYSEFVSVAHLGILRCSVWKILNPQQLPITFNCLLKRSSDEASQCACHVLESILLQTQLDNPFVVLSFHQALTCVFQRFIYISTAFFEGKKMSICMFNIFDLIHLVMTLMGLWQLQVAQEVNQCCHMYLQ